MILKELFDNLDPNAIIDLSQKLYGWHEDKTEAIVIRTFDAVRDKLPRPDNKVQDLEIAISKITKDDETYFDVCGYSSQQKEYYAIEFTDWDIWLGLPISDSTKNNFTEEEVLTHCIQEMTLFGTEESMTQQRKELEQLIEDIDSGKEKLIEFNSLEDLLDEIKKEK